MLIVYSAYKLFFDILNTWLISFDKVKYNMNWKDNFCSPISFNLEIFEYVSGDPVGSI